MGQMIPTPCLPCLGKSNLLYDIPTKWVPIELDIGRLCLFLIPHLKCNTIDIILSTYTGENLMILGICDVPVDYQSQSQILPLLVMYRCGPSLLVEIDLK